MARRVRRRGLGFVAALRPAHEPVHAARHGHAAGGGDPQGPLRAAVDRLVHDRRPKRRPGPRARARGTRRRRARSRPATDEPPRQRDAGHAGGDGRAARLRSRAGRFQEPHGRHARSDRRHPWCDGLPDGTGGDRARPRPGLRRGPHQGRAHRASDRVGDPRRHIWDARVPDPVRLRARDDPDHPRDRVGLRELHGAVDLPAEPRVADRARDRDRLLAPRRLPLPRRASGRASPRRGDRQDDGDGRPRRRLQRDGGRDRARDARLHAAPVHPRVRDRRPVHPCSVGARRRHLPSGRAVAGRRAPRPHSRAAAQVARAPRRHGARLLGCARALHHAVPEARRERDRRLPDPAHAAAPLAPARARLERGHPEGPLRGTGIRRAHGGGRCGGGRADEHRGRHGPAGAAPRHRRSRPRSLGWTARCSRIRRWRSSGSRTRPSMWITRAAT